MPSRKNQFHAPGVDLELLDQEHSNIHRQYVELDDAILHGQGSPRILQAARTLVEYMLMHFTHEERLQDNVREAQRNAWKENLAELLQIEARLKLEEVDAALRLRGFCKRWVYEHRYVERGSSRSLPGRAHRSGAGFKRDPWFMGSA
jgi:hemerythrin